MTGRLEGRKDGSASALESQKNHCVPKNAVNYLNNGVSDTSKHDSMRHSMLMPPHVYHVLTPYLVLWPCKIS